MRAVKIEVVGEADASYLTRYVLGDLPDNADDVLAAMATMLPADGGSRTVTIGPVYLAEVDTARLPAGMQPPRP